MDKDVNVTVEEAAQILRVSRATVWAWCKKGLVPAFKLPHSRRWLINSSELERLQRKLRKEYAST